MRRESLVCLRNEPISNSYCTISNSNSKPNEQFQIGYMQSGVKKSFDYGQRPNEMRWHVSSTNSECDSIGLAHPVVCCSLGMDVQFLCLQINTISQTHNTHSQLTHTSNYVRAIVSSSFEFILFSVESIEVERINICVRCASNPFCSCFKLTVIWPHKHINLNVYQNNSCVDFTPPYGIHSALISPKP